MSIVVCSSALAPAVQAAADKYMPGTVVLVATTAGDLSGPAKPDPKPTKQPKTPKGGKR